MIDQQHNADLQPPPSAFYKKILFILLATLLFISILGSVLWYINTNDEQTGSIAKEQISKPEMSATVFGTVQEINRTNGTITIEIWINADQKEDGEKRLFTGKVTSATRFSRLVKKENGAPERIQVSFAEVSEGQNIMASRKYQLERGEEETFIFVQIFN